MANHQLSRRSSSRIAHSPARFSFIAPAAAAAFAACLFPACSTLKFWDRDGSADKPALESHGSAEYNTALMRVDLAGAVRPVVIQLRPDAAPKTVANFKENVLAGEYDGVAFHRVIPNYLVQTGDPLSKDSARRTEWGTGGSENTIPAEIKLPHTKGAVAMARLGNEQNPSKASSDSQFYIALRRLSSLDDEYTVFGEVTQGMDVLEDMTRQVVDTNDNPVRRVEVESIVLVPEELAVEDADAADGVGDRRNTIPASQKGPFTRFIERIW